MNVYVCVCAGAMLRAYQVLEAGPPVLQQRVEDDGGRAAAVGLAVHQALEQHEHQGGQLLLGEPLAHHLGNPPHTNTAAGPSNTHTRSTL